MRLPLVCFQLNIGQKAKHCIMFLIYVLHSIPTFLKMGFISLFVFQISFLSPVSNSFPASAYQWRWVWEQRQRSSGTVSGSCRPNALGCCGWSGIRGQGETWANQHAERGRRRGGRFGHKKWETSQSECCQRTRREERDAHKNQHHNIAIEWKKETKKGKEVFTPCLCLSRKLMQSSQLKISVSHTNIHRQQGCKHNRRRWRRLKQDRD